MKPKQIRQGARKPLKRKESVTRQIESWPKIRTREEAWVRSPRKKLVATSIKRKAMSVESRQAERLPYKQRIHSHPKADKKFSALPSVGDIAEHMHRFPKHKGTSIIASLNNKGKVIGHTFLRTRGKERTELPVFITESTINPVQLLEFLKEVLAENGVNLRIRFVPARGYVFDRQNGRFVPKK